MQTSDEYYIIKKLDLYISESGKLHHDINDVKIFDYEEDAIKAIKYYCGFNVSEEARLFKILKVTRETKVTEIDTPKTLVKYIKETMSSPVLTERKYYANPTAITNKMDIVKSRKGIWRNILRFLSPLGIIKKTL
jgi:hypothetical protein